MSDQELRTITHVRDLVELASLSDVVFYQLSGERVEEDEDAAGGEAHEAAHEEDAPLEVLARHDAERIQVRVRCEALSRQGRFVADVAAEFALAEPVAIEGAVLREFVERVGVMAAYPFVREGLHSTASKLRVQAPLLQLLRANQISLTPNQD
ncbi:hypothetical protein GCU67_20985 [Modestobacter muralis]|uniref:Preprotein translocase subunit SecB n=1 Tax=Modestobacter muralis TaxID=1608614 RepID=A0A6P0EY68_9ACTN|nr:hypothetical protein [Modestobacter muralis]NEK96622.1 hypothetical protein [Modestobacter muralis]NEN53541.1 hypothetical protein [Modestobacter muralis]